MEVIEHHLTQAETSRLATFRDSRWDFVATSGMVIGNIFTCPVIVCSADQVLEFQIEDNEDLVDGSYETLTKVAIGPTEINVKDVTMSGKLFVHGRGEICQDVYVIQEDLTKYRDGSIIAEISSHSGVVFHLERRWIAVQRRGFHGFDYVINQSFNLNELQFFESAREFPHNLIVNYEYDRKLILLQ
jgi:hypothetical protein